MADEKDRFGDKMREAERGREDDFFMRRDRALIEKMRKEKESAAEAAARSAPRMLCPKCGASLTAQALARVTVELCPQCGGVWLDKGELEEIASRERESWLGRLFRLSLG